jgi:hypothetical protein
MTSRLQHARLTDVNGCAESAQRIKERRMEVNTEGEDTGSERREIHFLAALLDELMRKMLAAGALTQADLNEIESAAAKRVGGEPRAW